MQDAGLTIEPELIHKVEFTIEGGYRAMETFIEQGNLPTAIFACNSLMAIGVMKIARKAGLRIPDDISVMGFDDIPEAMIVEPPLTVVARDLPHVGQQVAEIVFKRIDGEYTGNGHFFQSQWQLLERESVRQL